MSVLSAAPSPATVDLLDPSPPQRTVDLVLDPWGAAVLLVSPQPSTVRRMEEALMGPGDEIFHLTSVRSMAEAVGAVRGQEFSAALVDDALPEASAEGGFEALQAAAPELPIVTVSPGEIAASLGTRRAVAKKIWDEPVLGVAPVAREGLTTDDVTQLVRIVSTRGAPRGLALGYVPLVRGPAGAVGVRACLRWAPQGRVAQDAHFRRRVRRVDRHHVLWRWTLEAVCAQVTALDDAGLTSHVVSLPVEPEALADREVRRILRQTLRERDVVPERLRLELTEEAVLRDVDAAERVVHELRLMGCGVAMVEVGRAFSRLSTLATLPVDVLELDEQLVGEMPSPRCQRGVAGILAFARAVGALPAAAGVRTEHQARVLRELGCQQMRGPRWGPPLDAARMVEWLEAEE